MEHTSELIDWYITKFGKLPSSWGFYKFGSKSSLDHDIGIIVPLEYLGNNPHVLLKENLVIDKLMKKMMNTNMDVNSCFVYIEDGVVVACQKGSIEETNNSIFITFGFHSNFQMFKICPIQRMLIRDLKSVQLKMLGATRMIVSTLAHANFIRNWEHNMKRVLTHIMKIPEFQTLNDKEIKSFKILCFKIHNLNKHVLNTCCECLEGEDKTIVMRKYGMLVDIRKKLAKILKNMKNMNNETFIDEFFELYGRSKLIVGEITDVIYENQNKFDSNFIKQVQSDIQGCELTLKPITSFILKVRYLCFQTEYLSCMDFNNIEMHTDVQDKHKKIAFQIGQSVGLLYDKELFEKETISETFSGLYPFLFRIKLKDEDWHYFTDMMQYFVRVMYDKNIVKRNFIELEMK